MSEPGSDYRPDAAARWRMVEEGSWVGSASGDFLGTIELHGRIGSSLEMACARTSGSTGPSRPQRPLWWRPSDSVRRASHVTTC